MFIQKTKDNDRSLCTKKDFINASVISMTLLLIFYFLKHNGVHLLMFVCFHIFFFIPKTFCLYCNILILLNCLLSGFLIFFLCIKNFTEYYNICINRKISPYPFLRKYFTKMFAYEFLVRMFFYTCLLLIFQKMFLFNLILITFYNLTNC